MVAESAALGILAREADIRPTELVSHLYSLRNAYAARHLFRVTAGLDAMIVGEAEIQGQVKRAYELALVENTTSAFMNRLFREALAAGKRVRTETGIGSNTVSLSSVAVELAQETLGDLSGRRVIVIGAGETGELTARALMERGVSSVFVANRHYDRAIGLAQRFGGQAVRFDVAARRARAGGHRGLLDRLAASHRGTRGSPVGDGSTRRAAAAADRHRGAARHRPGGTRASPACTCATSTTSSAWWSATCPGVRPRRVAPRRCSSGSWSRFERWLGTLDVVPTIAALHGRGEAVARQVLAENNGRWESLSEADRERVELMAGTIVRRLLHQPTMRLKASAEDDGTYAYVQALRELFGLDTEKLSAFEARQSAVPADETADDSDAPAAEVTSIRSRRQHRKR